MEEDSHAEGSPTTTTQQVVADLNRLPDLTEESTVEHELQSVLPPLNGANPTGENESAVDSNRSDIEAIGQSIEVNFKASEADLNSTQVLEEKEEEKDKQTEGEGFPNPMEGQEERGFAHPDEEGFPTPMEKTLEVVLKIQEVDTAPDPENPGKIDEVNQSVVPLLVVPLELPNEEENKKDTKKTKSKKKLSFSPKNKVYETEKRRSPRSKPPPPPPPPRPIKKGKKENKSKAKVVEEELKYTEGFALYLNENRKLFNITENQKIPPKTEKLLYGRFVNLPSDTKKWYEQRALEVSADESEGEDVDIHQFVCEPRSVNKDVDEEEVEEEMEDEEEEEVEDEDDDLSHHGNATNAFIRFQNVRLFTLQKQNPNLKMTRDFKDEILREWHSMTKDQQQPFLSDAAKEKKRKAEMKQREGDKEKKRKRKQVADKKKGKEKKKLKHPRRCQSYLSLPQIKKFYEKMTDEQRSWMYEVGLGGLEHLQITGTPEDFNKFIYNAFEVDGYLTAHGRSLKITDEIVGWLFGISWKGEVFKPEPTDKEAQLIGQSIGLVKPVSSVESYVKWFRAEENENILTDEWKRRAVAFVLGVFGMPLTRQGVRSTLARYVVDLEKLKKVNWAATWLHHFQEQQTKVQRGKSIRGGGCILIPMLLYLEKFCPMLCKNPEGCNNPDDFPRMG